MAQIKLAANDQRSRILDVAQEAFAIGGFHGVSLNAIARASGLSNPGLIHYFPTKASLYLAVLTRMGEEIVDSLTRALDGRVDPKDRLQALIRSQLDWTFSHPQAVQLTVRELIDNASRLDSAESLPLSGLVRILLNEIGRAQEAGLLPGNSPVAHLATLLGTLTYGLIVRPTFLKMNVEAEQIENVKSWSNQIAEVLFSSFGLSKI